MENDNVVELSIDLLIPNAYQPRKSFNETSLNELALSIKEYGVLNPVLVRKKNDKYEIIAGERRVRAAKIAGISKVPAIIKDIDDAKLAEIALIENLQRESITPIEEANSYKDILHLTNKTEQELSQMIGKSQSSISNKLRLLSLPKEAQDALNNRKISERHARSLLTVKDTNKQIDLLNRVINEKLTVKELDNIINEKQITETEITKTIDDIMKSLHQLDEENNKKEEKESDNMNNGSFFPNYNTNVDPNNNNVSLNNMNMQTLNNVAPVPNVEINGMSQPVENPNNNFSMPTEEIATQAVASSIDTPAVSNQPFVYNAEPAATVAPLPMDVPITPTQPDVLPSVPEPGFNANQPQVMPDNNSVSSPLPDIPLFSTPEVMNQSPDANNFNQSPIEAVVPSVTPAPIETPVTPVIDNNILTPPMMDTPLFSGNNNVAESPVMAPSAPVENNNFEVPVTETVSTSVDKLAEVTNLLNNNGVNYKLYSNETGHCIIIEL